MSSVFQWFKNKFNQYIFGENKEELINEIDKRSEIPFRVRDDLIVSLLDDYPQRVFDKLNDNDNQIPQETKNYFMDKVSEQFVPHTNSLPSMCDGVLGMTHLLSANDCAAVNSASYKM